MSPYPWRKYYSWCRCLDPANLLTANIQSGQSKWKLLQFGPMDDYNPIMAQSPMSWRTSAQEWRDQRWGQRCSDPQNGVWAPAKPLSASGQMQHHHWAYGWSKLQLVMPSRVPGAIDGLSGRRVDNSVAIEQFTGYCFMHIVDISHVVLISLVS